MIEPIVTPPEVKTQPGKSAGRWGRWFRRTCAAGFLTNVLLITLPARLKPTVTRRWCFDYKYLLDEITTQTGFGPRGFIRVRRVNTFEGYPADKLDQYRRAWAEQIKGPQPTGQFDGRTVQFDEWGPNRTALPDKVERKEIGSARTLPYSLVAWGFFSLLTAQRVLELYIHRLHRRFSRARIQTVDPVMSDPV